MVYSCLEKARIEICERKEIEEISEQFCSLVVQSQEISVISLDDSCILDLKSIKDLPDKHSHKCVVKTILSLYWTKGFIKNDKLVAAVWRAKVSPAGLSTIFCVFNDICNKHKHFVGSDNSYLKTSSKMTKLVLSAFRKKMNCPKKPSCALGLKN